MIILNIFPGTSLSINTPNDNKFNHGWMGVQDQTYFSFSVTACNDAFLSLALQPGEYNNQTYEIKIGGWDNTK